MLLFASRERLLSKRFTAFEPTYSAGERTEGFKLHWTIGKKIAAGFLTVVAVMLLVSLIGLWTTVRTSKKMELVASEYLPVTELANCVEGEVLNARIHFIYFVTIQKEGALDKGWARFRKVEQDLPRLQELVRRSEALAGVRGDAEQLDRAVHNYRPVLEHIIDVVQKHQNQGAEFDALIKEWARLGGAMVESAGRLDQRGSQVTKESATQAALELNRAATIMFGAGLLSLLVGLALAFFITRGISGALKAITETLNAAVHQVSGAVHHITGSANALAQGASEQAAVLEETSASTQEINSMASRNAENSKSAALKMTEAAERTNEANQNLVEMIVSMNEIQASSDKISKIIKVIDQIAFQTNILALNAAVEAARAGEAGMGFAVVADEVRSLAQRSAQAAKDTAELIQESIAKTSVGKDKLDHVAAAVRSLTGSASSVKTLVDEVELGSQEQARGIEQVAKAIAQMEQVTQSAAAHAEESASAGEQLSAQAETLSCR